MSEFYMKSIRPCTQLRKGANGCERMIQVTISSVKSRTGIELVAEDGETVIGEAKFNISTGENTIEVFIAEATVPRKISLKMFYKGFQTNYYEVDILPVTISADKVFEL